MRLTFPATHIAFSWTGSEDATISYRTDAAGSWVEVPIAHDADTETRNYSGVLAVDRAREIEWRVETQPGAAIGDLTLDYLNTVDGPRETRSIPATAQAEARTPDIITRAEWGADESLKRTTGGCRRAFHPVQQLFVHHTAGSNFDDQPKATMRAIYWYHVARLGWCDIGYNFVISPDGRIFEGRWARDYSPWEVHDSESKSGRAVAGAHVDGYNSGSIGVSLMGNFETARPSPAARRSLSELIAWEVDSHDLKAQGSHVYRNPESGQTKKMPWVAGHRDADPTACPGNYLYSQLPAVRRDAAAVIGAGKTSTSVALTASAERLDYGDSVTVVGTLTDEDGTALAARRIRTYLREGKENWIEGPSATTGADGTFALPMQPKANIRVAAIYDGDAETWGSESAVRVLVAPVASLTAEGGLPDAAGTYHYPAGTSQIRFSGNVEPTHAQRTVQIRIAKLGPDGEYSRVDEGSVELDRQSRFVFDWTVVDPGAGGSYKAHAFVPKHNDHTWGVSPVVTFVIDPQP